MTETIFDRLQRKIDASKARQAAAASPGPPRDCGCPAGECLYIDMTPKHQASIRCHSLNTPEGKIPP